MYVICTYICRKMCIVYIYYTHTHTHTHTHTNTHKHTNTHTPAAAEAARSWRRKERKEEAREWWRMRALAMRLVSIAITKLCSHDLYVCVYVCMYVCVCVCVCVYIYIYTHTHTYIHTCMHEHTRYICVIWEGNVLAEALRNLVTVCMYKNMLLSRYLCKYMHVLYIYV